MGEELVKNTNSPTKPYSDTFNEIFYLYLAMGMSEEQFWDKDVYLVKHYTKAQELKNKQRNEQAWLSGAYIYDALCCVSPILHAFAKEGTQPQPYPVKPYPTTKEEMDKIKDEKQTKELAEATARLESWMIQHNVKTKAKHEKNS